MNSELFFKSIENKWIKHTYESITDVFKVISYLIQSEKNLSGEFKVHHPILIKEFIESACDDTVTVNVLSSSSVSITINVEYGLFTDTQLNSMRKSVAEQFPVRLD